MLKHRGKEVLKNCVKYRVKKVKILKIDNWILNETVINLIILSFSQFPICSMS